MRRLNFGAYSQAILPPSVPNVLAKYPTRAAFAAVTPTRLESQVLVNHCMGTLGALHPIINSEARQQHLVHFWVVESPLQLEHCYSSWLVGPVSLPPARSLPF